MRSALRCIGSSTFGDHLTLSNRHGTDPYAWWGTLVIFAYGGLLFGILPIYQFVSFEAHFFGLCARHDNAVLLHQGIVSFEAHFFGLCAGVLAARLLAMRRR